MTPTRRQPRGIEVRPVRERDVSDLVELLFAYIDFYERPRPERRQMNWLVRELLERPSDGRQFIARAHGQMVGFATLYFTFSTLKARRVAVLNDLYVVPESRREGVGSRLFETCLAYTRTKGYGHMEWVTAPGNRRARALYEKMGAERGNWVQYSI